MAVIPQSEFREKVWTYGSATIIVAHPDDETLWAGGIVLLYPETQWQIVALCRATDPDRAPKFARVLKILNAEGAIGDMDDGPEQTPLPPDQVREVILSLLAGTASDLLITHGSNGEYTRHRRHEETAAAVRQLWQEGMLQSPELWQFAYSDEGGSKPVHALADADKIFHLPPACLQQKFDLITRVYGFSEDSFEARSVLLQEAFRCQSRTFSHSGGFDAKVSHNDKTGKWVSNGDSET